MKPIRFLHIPKTAGTTFSECLVRLYGGQNRCFSFMAPLETDLKIYAALPAKEKIQLVLGHAPRQTTIPEADQLPTITFLREPVNRVRSFCQHVSEGKSPYLLESYPPESFNLDEFLSSGKHELDNLQIRSLTGYSGDINRENYKVYLDDAIRVLRDEIVCFGLTERFDESLMLMKFALNWPWPTYRTLNKKDKVRSIRFTDEQNQKIREMNFADIMLYEAAVEIFNTRIEEHRNELAAALKDFSPRQKRYNKYIKIRELAARLIGRSI